MAKRSDRDDDHKTTPLLGATGRAPLIQSYRLEVVDGPDTGEQWQSSGERCTVGTHRSCDFELTDDTVSRFHCELTPDQQRVRMRDLDSSNGTTIDGVEAHDAYLKHGSLLQLGQSAVRVHFEGKPYRRKLSERTHFGELFGQSIAMRHLYAILERVAELDVTVLLEGETGTGKSLCAHSLHLESPRKDQPFIMVDCGALPGNLLESELFGHEKGSFTGAHKRRIGAFEEASSGTIFLDEIGELPRELQTKLLTVLESRKIRRVGANRSTAVDVRIIAATNRDLRSEVNHGHFREDLYYRLAVVSVEVPPLRQRLEDLPLLIKHLLERQRVPEKRIARLMNPGFLLRAQRQAWPGNVRELRNHLQQQLLWADDEPDDDWGQESVAAVPDQPANQLRFDASLPLADARQQVIDEFDRAYVVELLRNHDGKVSRAAAHAGVHRTHLYRMMQRLRINRDS